MLFCVYVNILIFDIYLIYNPKFIYVQETLEERIMRIERYKRYAQSKREDIPIPGDHLRKAINILIQTFNKNCHEFNITNKKYYLLQKFY